jgi:hypothetical protein
VKEKRSGGLAGGCCAFVCGLLLGAALTILALIAWALVRPVNLFPIGNRLPSGGADLEVRLSEAYLNKAIARELVEGDMRNVTSIIVDARDREQLDATLEGSFELGGIVPPSPRLEAELQLGSDEGLVNVYVARIGVGPVSVVRDSVPDLFQSLFESVEDTIAQTINAEIQADGYWVQAVHTDEDGLTLELRE